MEEENIDNTQRADQHANNTKQHIKIVDDHISGANESLIEYQNQIEDLRSQLKVMQVFQNQQIDDVKSSIQPMVENVLRELVQAVSLQKEENKRQQINITSLKKKAYEIQQEIQVTDLNAQKLQDIIGDYLLNQE